MTKKEYPKEQYLHCRYCNWKTLKFFHDKKGKLVVGYKRLRRHVEHAHIEELMETEYYV